MSSSGTANESVGLTRGKSTSNVSVTAQYGIGCHSLVMMIKSFQSKKYVRDRTEGLRGGDDTFFTGFKKSILVVTTGTGASF
jgi:hypothetical protein